jgi:hypothetical protein
MKEPGEMPLYAKWQTAIGETQHGLFDTPDALAQIMTQQTRITPSLSLRKNN